ncbi:phosphoribosylformylglycinamidine cyclo-ligase [Methermicoccus shengliensis]|uniref:Phosphoribosylformylglycinamidine cyclo-ligase n=1 Tax=Methermicoccus shengliensis TaxID=660064 RepID=A0A832RY06_9EURY|nr:phosphoribosylformylglycinamidine cyclo-ligase [Methermicoccus shengliensis]KUK04980.1 MAG: Phosphoribosylformylglycinamidine cyclo-ligase [Euryarchaeota archaeon 55_53]KUK30861.1 MAG: Phosphoribosylformylglycinamidine cyclo-ligase [Methanosarcinales archeaon 56_1174]MDI3488247.1 phosphoribosylformylglycinamidine cyclo-ligase [Methanosarcinales archaeon]MDN5295005.1 phosphoribosylformylglycinamidine cyclo-ligase [Methanosarcinales archaeon]HIH70017.1 phosphoribosylformylglycinamidine cyclo-
MVKTYREAGVDIRREQDIIRSLSKALSYRREGWGAPLHGIGHYAGLIDLGEYVLALTTDGVGSKVLVARALGRYDTIGIDCIAMNVNDLLCVGAEPLAFVDYLALEHMDEHVAAQIGKGLSEGARLANISVVGGETATLPELIRGFDLAGSAVGIVKRDALITGERIEVGDVLIGIPSSGLHSNGYTLARRLVEEAGLSYTDPFPLEPTKSIGEVMLIPTRIYTEVLQVLRRCEVHALAHITGGGLTKLRRLTSLGFHIHSPLPPQPIFRFLQELGDIEEHEMYTTFNMGMGFLVVCPPSESTGVLSLLKDARVVGEVVEEGITVGDIEL